MVVFPPGIPPTAQFTELLLTPGVKTCNCNVCEVVTLDSAGESESGPWIELSDRMVTLDDPVLVESDYKTAATVTVGWFGTNAGAA